MDKLFSTILSRQPSMLQRLKEEALQAVYDFFEDPRLFIKTMFSSPTLGAPRRLFLQFGFAFALVLYAAFFAMVLVLWTIGPAREFVARNGDEGTIRWLPLTYPDTPPDKREPDKRPGGGGGGNLSNNPASQGIQPEASPRDPLVAPSPKPQDRDVELPVPETILAPAKPRLDDITPTGLVSGVIAPPDPGPGNNKGIGNGKDGGIGNDEGPGVGPGKDGGPGGGGIGLRGGVDRPLRPHELDSQPVMLNRERPNYTEDARRNRVQGVVKTKILIGKDGLVTNVVLLTHLPDGLDEEAIRAARRLRFVPARKNGAAVAVWVPLDIQFTLR
ncbi:MAG TPA: energy transducer TonB [Blastocatellia bacterium]|nr:energy transducer TonB [Blastocatellia bacterium]